MVSVSAREWRTTREVEKTNTKEPECSAGGEEHSRNSCARPPVQFFFVSAPVWAHRRSCFIALNGSPLARALVHACVNEAALHCSVIKCAPYDVASWSRVGQCQMLATAVLTLPAPSDFYESTAIRHAPLTLLAHAQTLPI